MEEIWSISKGGFIEKPIEIINFINDIKQVCLKHNLSISHEDGHGSFIIESYNEDNIDWLNTANLG